MRKLKAIVLGLSISVIMILLIPYVVTIDSIKCSSQYGTCSRKVTESLKGITGSTLKDSPVLIENKLQEMSIVLDYSVRFRPFSTVYVDIVEDKAEFALYDFDEGMYYIYNSDIEVLKVSDSTELPKLVPSSESLDISLDNNLFVVELLASINQHYDVSTLTISDNKLIAVYNGIQVIFPTSGDVDVLLGSLELLLFQLNPELQNLKIERRIESIDLRFKNVIVK